MSLETAGLRPLSGPTITEALRRSRRRTAVLFLLLAFLYLGFAHLIALIFFVHTNPRALLSLNEMPPLISWVDQTILDEWTDEVMDDLRRRNHGVVSSTFYSEDEKTSELARLGKVADDRLAEIRNDRGRLTRHRTSVLLRWFSITVLLSMSAALVHFWFVRRRTLDSMLELMGARNPDPNDEIHKRFVNIVSEVELAVGLTAIRPCILPTLGANAFSLEDSGRGSARGRAIGITEGCLAKLNRAELTAVVAHEAAHLAHGDARLATLASTLFMVFRVMRRKMSEWIKHGRLGPRGALAYLSIAGVSLIADWLGTLLYCVISREREHYADADAAYMTKDPLAMAEALRKIAGSYRGSVEIPPGFSSLFIVNPQSRRMDEKRDFISNLFSTHPPVAERIDRMVVWARTHLPEGVRRPAVADTAHVPDAPAGPGYFIRRQDAWDGPFTILQMQSTGTLMPGDWICAAGTENVTRAGDDPLLLPMFDTRLPPSRSRHTCPHCHVPLVERRYEGAPLLHCAFCSGHMLKSDVLQRLITRREKTFSAQEAEAARQWRSTRRNQEQPIDGLPRIPCPYCGKTMYKHLHSMLTAVVIDRCGSPACGAVWLDGNELERIQILIETAERES